MNPKSLLLIVVALVVAGATAMLARGWLSSNRAQPVTVEAAPVQASTKILVANQNVPIGKIMTLEDMRWQPWPENSVDERHVEQSEADVAKFVGKVARFGIRAGEPVIEQFLVGPGDRGFMAAILTPGMRAITVPINAISGISGFVFPGDRIDLILIHEVDGRQVSETVLKNVRVLAVDTRTNDQSGQPAQGKTVTLEVTPKLAEKITLVQRLGQLSLSLRSLASADGGGDAMTPADSQPITNSRTHTWDAEVSGLLPPVSGVAGNSVKVTRGGQTSVVKTNARNGQ